MKYIFLQIICFILIPAGLFSQNYPVSAGPAPYVYNTAPQSPVFDAAVGTRYFSQIYTNPAFQFGKAILENCTSVNIGASISIPFPGGLVYKNGSIYTWNQTSPYQLWSIDTITGVHTLVFNLTGVPYTYLTGLCWDGTTMYGLSTSLTRSQIFYINMITGICTPIGTSSTLCAGGMTLLGRPGALYSLFIMDIVSDNLYKGNKTTGAITLVGPLGLDLNFGQDGSVDPNDGKFYAMCYSTISELRRVDTATGSLGPVLCTYNTQATGMACVPNSYPGLPVTTICRQGLNKPINDFSLILDSILVSLGNTCVVVDINVRIDSVLHTRDADLSFYLQKGFLNVNIVNHVGGTGDNFIGTILNDSSIDPISTGTAPFTESYKPSSPLSVYNNQPTDGYWKLLISDSTAGETGILKRWCLEIVYYCYIGGIQTLEIPNYYFLDQNYPNPFNPVTNIKFGIPERGDVKLVVYDILGREVRTLINEFKNPGTYEVKFNGTEVASGIYFYSLQTIRGIETKRMLIIK